MAATNGTDRPIAWWPIRLADRILADVDRIFVLIASIGILALMIIGGLEVLARTTGYRVFRGQVEWSEVILVTMVYLALAHAQRTRQHVSVDLLVRKLPPKPRKLLTATSDIITAMFLIAISWTAATIALHSFAIQESRYGTANAPIWPARSILAIGLFLTALRLIVQALTPDDEKSGAIDVSEGI